MTPIARRAVLATVLVSVMCPSVAAAHRMAPSLLALRELDDGRVEAAWTVPTAQPSGESLTPELPVGCAIVGQPIAEREASRATLRWQLDCSEATGRGLAGAVLGVRGLESRGAHALVRVELADGRRFRSLLHAAQPSFTIPERQSAFGVAQSYASLGVRHILGGPDHLLFVLGLLLLVTSRRQLLWTITAFTAGHSVTLAIAALGWLRLPSGPVEVAIALTLFWLAVEIAAGAPRRSTLGRHPFWMAGAFGLVHGLGFAGALAEIGLPDGEIPLALAAFNVGIELGQLAFVAVALAAAAVVTRLTPRPLPIAWLSSYVIGSLAVYWILERIAWLV